MPTAETFQQQNDESFCDTRHPYAQNFMILPVYASIISQPYVCHFYQTNMNAFRFPFAVAN